MEVKGIGNSNGGGVTYYQKIGNIVYVTLTINTLLYTWNAGAHINNTPLPQPISNIPFLIMQLSGDALDCYLNEDGYIIAGAHGIGREHPPIQASFSYVAK